MDFMYLPDTYTHYKEHDKFGLHTVHVVESSYSIELYVHFDTQCDS